jgi:multidrug efflux system membrane fusion protein
MRVLLPRDAGDSLMTISFLSPNAARWKFVGSGLPFALLAALTAVGCSSSPANKEAKKVEVIVTTPITDDVVEYQDFTGRLDAYKTAEIRSRVPGYVTSIPFKEGDLVHKGELLFQIDPSQYQADFNLAVANLAVAEADATLQQKNVVRANQLKEAGGGAISDADVDAAVAAWEKAKATIGAMKASRDRAKVYLDYTHVTAPFDGRISRRNVDPGNDVTADTTLLTTLVTETPVYAYFDVDERTYQALMKAAQPSDSSFLPQLQSKVLMRVANEDKFERVGVVNFVDNRVIATTGTIRLRGVFDNTKIDLTSGAFGVSGIVAGVVVTPHTRGDLRSGMFARIRMPTRRLDNKLLIPDEAVLTDQGRKYLYIINDNNEVEYRDVELGQAIEGLRVILKGLKAGEKVVVVGMQRVKPKQVVSVKMQDPPKAPDSPLKRLIWDAPAVDKTAKAEK